jgi:hypothetical protein
MNLLLIVLSDEIFSKKFTFLFNFFNINTPSTNMYSCNPNILVNEEESFPKISVILYIVLLPTRIFISALSPKTVISYL